MKKAISSLVLLSTVFYSQACSNTKKVSKVKSPVDLYNTAMTLREHYRGKVEVLKEVDSIANELISRDATNYQGFLLKSWVLKRETYLNSVDGYNLEKFKISLEYLNKAISKNPSSLDLYPDTISAMVIIGDFMKAEQLLSEYKIKLKSKQMLPLVFYYQIELANFFLKQQKFEESKKAAIECLTYTQNDSQRANCLYYQAESFTLEKKYKESIDVYKNMLKLIPDDPWTLSNLSSVYYQLRNYDDAIDTAQRAMAIRKFGMVKSNLNWAYYGKAWVHLKAGDNEKALEYFKKIDLSEIEIKLAEFMANQLFYKLNDNELFLKVASSALKDFPESSKLNFLMGEYFFYTKKDVQNGLKYYNKVEQLVANNGDKDSAIEAYSRLGWIYNVNLKEQDKALEYYKKLKPLAEASKDPKVIGDTYYGLGKCYHEIGWTNKEIATTRDALTNYQEALKYIPEKRNEIEKNIRNAEINIVNFSKI